MSYLADAPMVTRSTERMNMRMGPQYDVRTSEFTGRIKRVQISIGDDSHDHLLDPAGVWHIALSRQWIGAEMGRSWRLCRVRFNFGAICLMVHWPSELRLCRRHPHLCFLPRSETGGERRCGKVFR